MPILNLDAHTVAPEIAGSPVSAPAAKPRRAFAVPVLGIFTCLLILGSFAFRLDLLKSREFDPDEFEHLHSAWSLSEGQIPFRDYFEHHTPGLYLVLAPTFSFFDVDHSPDDAVAFLFFARRIMWCFTGVILGLTFYLGVLVWKDVRVACIGTALLALNIVFLGKTLEIRPDVLATAFWLSSLVFSARAMSLANRNRVATWCFFGSGLCLGVGLVCSQKLLLAGPGMVVSVIWYCLDRQLPGTLAWRVQNIVWQALGTLAPVVVVLGFFAWQSSLYAFIRCNFLLNLGWQQETTVGDTLRWLILRDPFFIALAVPGALLELMSLVRNRRLFPAGVLIFANTLGLFVGLFVIPVPYPQYCLLFLPIVALYAGAFIVWLVKYLQGIISNTTYFTEISVARPAILIGVLSLMLCLCMYIAAPQALGPWFYPFVGAITVIAACLFSKAKRIDFALATLLIPGLVCSLQQISWMKGLSNKEAVSNLRFVMERTKPEDIVMDGWSGLGVFRPHAWYYAFAHGGVRSSLDKQKLSQFEDDIKNRTIAPKLVILDNHLAQLSPRVTSYIRSHYRRCEMTDVWERTDENAKR